MSILRTPRLALVPATERTVDLELRDPGAFFRALAVCAADDWPSPNLVDALPIFRAQLRSDPSLVGWLSWYWVYETGQGRHLVGGGGFKGAPADGSVEVGYETRVAFRRQGFAAEAVSALVSWACNQPDVARVVAETQPENIASIGVLTKVGFMRAGAGSEAGLVRYEYAASSGAALDAHRMVADR